MSIFDTTIYGNTLHQWCVALLYLIGAFTIAKTTFWFIRKFVKRLASKTKTRLDDILVNMFEEPFVFAIVLFGSYLAINHLTLPDVITAWASKIYTFLVIINVTWFIARTVTSLMDNYLRRDAVKKFLTDYEQVAEKEGGWFWHRQNKALQYFNLLTLVVWWEEFVEGHEVKF